LLVHLSTMKVLFWFRKSESKGQSTKSDPEGSIQLRVTIDNEESEIGSTKITCKKSAWNAAGQCLNSKKLYYKHHNQKLARIASDLLRLHDVLITKYEYVTPAMVKEYYLTKKKFTYTMQEVKDAFFQHREKMVAQKSISETTYSVQLNYCRHILDFTEKYSINKPVQIQPNFFFELFEFIIDEGRSSERFARKVVAFSRQLLKWVVLKGLCPRISALDANLPGKADSEEDLDNTHLTITQLEKLYHFDFYSLVNSGQIAVQTAETLSAERDAFVFNCFTGMHHCDYSRKDFRIESSYNSLFLSGKRQKTKQKFRIKLLAPAVEILKKYGDQLASLPSKSNQKRNSTLKNIAIITGLPMKLTTKIARKTFCDLALNEMLMPADDVAACLGLSSTKYLKNYGRIREKRLIKTMKSWDELKAAS